MANIKQAREILDFFESESLVVAELVLALAQSAVRSRQKVASNVLRGDSKPSGSGATATPAKRRGRPPKVRPAPEESPRCAADTPEDDELES